MSTDNIYYSVEFLNLIHYRPVADTSLKLLVVLKGNVSIKESGRQQLLSAGDVYIVNQDVEWQLDSQTDNIVIIVKISSIWLLQHFDDFNRWQFFVNAQNSSVEVLQLRTLLINIATLWIKKTPDSWEMNIYRNLMDILCVLVESFKYKKEHEDTVNYSEKIKKTIDWIEERSHEDIKLYNIASKLYTSTEHLSRQFVKEVGMNFRDYLVQVRFNKAAKEIVSSDHPIGEVIQRNGISRPNSFNKMFKETFHMSPREYRSKNGNHHLQETEVSPLVNEKLGIVNSVELFTFLSQYNEEDQRRPLLSYSKKPHDTEIVFNDPVTPAQNRNYVIRIGSYRELLKHHIQQQLVLAKSISPFQYVELQDFIPTEASLCDDYYNEKLLTWSSWDSIDIAIRFLKEINMFPIIELPLSSSFSANLSFKKNVEKTLIHYKTMFGSEYLARWKFKLRIETDAKDDTIFNAKNDLIAVIKSQLPQCEVGILVTKKSNLISFFSRSALVENVDFIAVSICPNEVNDHLYHQDKASLRHDVSYYINSLLSEIHRRSVSCPVYLHSWSTLTGDTYETNGLFFRGALLMNALTSLPDSITMLGFWLNSEIQHEVQSHQHIDNNSLSLFFSSTTCRPVFHILKIKDRLQNSPYYRGDNWIAIKKHDAYQMLFFNPVNIDPDLSVQEHFLNDYQKKLNMKIHLTKPGIWRIKQWTFDQKNGALYHQYGLHPTLFERDQETMEYISSRSQPTLSVYDERLEDSFDKIIELDINAVVLLELKFLV
ncbi:helix-turn-helix transcriptional regulator [Vibrio sp.]|uniref:helix-turn-helix transcriptional regulator n=1 Tax=Vibrio sp. TaxID=678 RepID=UPI003D11E3CA